MIQALASRRAWRALVGGVSAAMIAGSAVAEVCVNPREEAALAARMLQTELMVAALTCGEQSRYNAIVGKHNRVLTDHGRDLKALFSRVYGKASTSQLTSFVTRLANEASMRSLVRASEYCEAAAALLGEVLDSESHELATLIERQPFREEHGFATCPTDDRRASLDRSLRDR